MGRKIVCFVLMSAILISHVAKGICAEVFADGGVVVAECSGVGRTLTAAKINARRDAAQKALGFLLEGTSLFESINSEGRNESKYEEKILRITRAFIGAGEEEIYRHEDKKRHIFSVGLRVKISGAELLNGLMQSGPEKSSIDGAAIVSSAIAEEKRRRDTADALTELFCAFPVADYVRVKVTSSGKFDRVNEELKLGVNFTFDRKRYFSEAVPAIVSVLDYVSDARMSDVPFLLPIENLSGGIASVSPSANVKRMSQYLSLAETENGNRLIGKSGYANIYIQTRDYYFNAYRVDPEAFVNVVRSLFRTNSGGMKGTAELEVNFVGESGRIVPSKPAGIKNLRDIMFFVNNSPTSMFSWGRRESQSDQKNSAIYIFPAFSFETGQTRDYALYQEENASLPRVKVSAEDLLSLGEGGSMQCSVVIRRADEK
ncbi:MAG: hypothetical protein IJQ58_04655 [Synergistaceae bacterium]|nr:hypothetical protein [Synergistaceae bacterium]